MFHHDLIRSKIEEGYATLQNEADDGEHNFEENSVRLRSIRTIRKKFQMVCVAF